MKAVNTILIFLLAFMLASCEKIVTDVEVPEVKPQLVVHTFLSPEDTLITVYVGKSRPIFGDRPTMELIDDAQITLSDDLGQTVAIPYSTQWSGYIINANAFPIQPGRTYSIKVIRGMDVVYGSCTVPTESFAFSETLAKDLGKPTPGFDGPYSLLTYKWQDQPGKENYYRVDIDARSKMIMMPGDTSYFYDKRFNGVFSDKNRDGAMLTGTYEDYSFSSDTSDLLFTLLHTDKPYYEYHLRRLNYVGDNPFGEPMQQYSNLTGGLGVICSYRKTSVLIKSK